MRVYIKPDDVRQMRGGMFKSTQIDPKLKCGCCKKPFNTLDKDAYLGLVLFDKSLKKANTIICSDCVSYLEEQGVENLEYKIQKEQDIKLSMTEEYKEVLSELGIKLNKWITNELESMNNEQLKEKLRLKKEELKKYKKKQSIINSVDVTTWLPLDKYLIDQYQVIENKEYLKHPIQIEDYFNDDYSGYFDCGQGYYEDIAKQIVHIGNKFYEVILKAQILSSKQDKGDRLYWVEELESVSYVEIDKPKRKEVFHSIFISELDIEKVRKILQKESISFKESI